MKKFIFFFILLLIVISISGITYSYKGKIQKTLFPSPTPTVTPTPMPGIVFPKGGENLLAGKSYTVKWKGLTGGITQIFLKDKSLEPQGESVSIVDRVYNVANTGSYNYTIPASANGSYVLEIGSYVSNPFFVVSNNVSYCTHDDLISDITTEGAAGNIYGTLKLTNLSSKTCSIIASNFVQADFTASNLTTQKKGNAGPKLLTLAPNQSVYSQFHFPNGPQCSGEIKNVDVSFKYEYAPESLITFEDNSGNSSVQINACKDTTVTQIDVWSIYPKPLNL